MTDNIALLLTVLVAANVILITLAVVRAWRRRRQEARFHGGPGRHVRRCPAPVSCAPVLRAGGRRARRARDRQPHGPADRHAPAARMEPDPRRRGGSRQALRATGHGRARRARWARSDDVDPRRGRGGPGPAGRRRFDQPACPRGRPRRPAGAGPVRHPAARDQRGRGRQLRRAHPPGLRAVARIRRDRDAPGDRLGEPGRR